MAKATRKVTTNKLDSLQARLHVRCAVIRLPIIRGDDWQPEFASKVICDKSEIAVHCLNLYQIKRAGESLSGTFVSLIGSVSGG
jgi:hypothetical protein